MTDELKCTCKGVLGHSRQCAMFDESKMEGLHRKALAMGDDPGVLGGAAGASEGQAEPVAQIVRRKTYSGLDVWDIKIFDKDMQHGTKLFTHPSAEIAALRERITAQDVDIAENDALIDQLRERIAGMEKDAFNKGLESAVRAIQKLDTYRQHSERRLKMTLTLKLGDCVKAIRERRRDSLIAEEKQP